jgi:hypothetical protein
LPPLATGFRAGQLKGPALQSNAGFVKRLFDKQVFKNREKCGRVRLEPVGLYSLSLWLAPRAAQTGVSAMR